METQEALLPETRTLRYCLLCQFSDTKAAYPTFCIDRQRPSARRRLQFSAMGQKRKTT